MPQLPKVHHEPIPHAAVPWRRRAIRHHGSQPPDLVPDEVALHLADPVGLRRKNRRDHPEAFTSIGCAEQIGEPSRIRHPKGSEGQGNSWLANHTTFCVTLSLQ